MTIILVLNSGSATIKYRVLGMPQAASLASGLEDALPDHRRALGRVLDRLRETCRGLFAVGHRVVHGGERHREPVRVDGSVVASIRSLSPLAPLHNPANADGIEAALALWPSVPQVAVFDTAFHRTLPPWASRYAIPPALQVRRYGFHGISNAFVTRRAAAMLGRPAESINLIALHLGNGASATAIRGGASVDTSMGMTPLEGLVMGTRCGDLDPAIPAILARAGGKTLQEIDGILNEHSGLRALAGTHDMREIERRAADGDADAALAIDVFAYRVKKYVGAYAAALGRVDAIVFTGGIGENSARVRSACLRDLSILGIEIDEIRNRGVSSAEREIQSPGGAVRILVVPADEEREIAGQTLRCLQGGEPP